MKAVMLAVQPKWCEKIANEEKKLEVRKTAPKCVPFKAYIYCTNTPQLHHLYDLRHVNGGAGKIRLGCVQHNKYSLVAGGWLNGKVIGEFIVDNVIEFESEFHDDNSTEELRRVWYDEDDGERDAELFAEDGEPNYLCTAACLTWYELKNYVGTGDRTFCAWHISDLKIYDKPKELHEFKRECPKISIKRADCITCPFEYYEPHKRVSSCDTYLKRPPQSWQYVEELQE